MLTLLNEILLLTYLLRGFLAIFAARVYINVTFLPWKSNTLGPEAQSALFVALFSLPLRKIDSIRASPSSRMSASHSVTSCPAPFRTALSFGLALACRELGCIHSTRAVLTFANKIFIQSSFALSLLLPIWYHDTKRKMVHLPTVLVSQVTQPVPTVRLSVHLYSLDLLNRLTFDLELLHVRRTWPWLAGDWRSRSRSWARLTGSVWPRPKAVCFL